MRQKFLEEQSKKCISSSCREPRLAVHSLKLRKSNLRQRDIREKQACLQKSHYSNKKMSVSRETLIFFVILDQEGSQPIRKILPVFQCEDRLLSLPWRQFRLTEGIFDTGMRSH